MANQSLNFFDYVKAAFNQKANVPGLGHLPVNKILLGLGFVLGIGNPGFWFLTAALEMGYLWFMSTNRNYQKIVESSRLTLKTEAWGQKQSQILAALDPESMSRYHRLLDKCSSIIKAASNDGRDVDDFQTSGLNQLIWMFIKLLSSRKKMNHIIATTSLPDLEKEIDELTNKITAEPENSALARSLQGTLDIQKRRQENLIKAKENLKVVEAELDRIEKQVTLLNEEASVSSDPEMLSMRLDSVMNSLSGTSKWMSEQSELFGMIEESTMPEALLHHSLQKKQAE